MKQHKTNTANTSSTPVETDDTEETFKPATDQEIECERVRRTREQRAKHLDFVGQFSFHSSPKFMDYLHGDVIEEEALTACLYEYARESKGMWDAAKLRDEARAKWNLDSERAYWKVHYEIADWINVTGLMNRFLMCDSFPLKDWNELTHAQRKNITGHYETRKVQPLHMMDIWSLKAFGLLDKFKAMGDEAKPVVEDVPAGKTAKPMKLGWPILQQHESYYQAIFTLDFSEGETRLGAQFREWLRLPENKELLAKYKKSKTGTTGKPLDRLKDLAAWRLYREFGNDWNKSNEFARDNRKRFKGEEISKKYKTKEQRKKFQSGSHRPFHNAKRQDGKPSYEADLFGEPADAYKTQASAWKHLIELFPHEFALPGPHMLATFVDLEKLSSKG